LPSVALPRIRTFHSSIAAGDAAKSADILQPQQFLRQILVHPTHPRSRERYTFHLWLAHQSKREQLPRVRVVSVEFLGLQDTKPNTINE